MPLTNAQIARLRPRLDRLARGCDLAGIAPDPLECVHAYDGPADREVAGFIAAALAYGRVAQILRSVRTVLALLGPHPAARTRALRPGEALRLFHGVRHRFSTGRDIARMVLALGEALRRSGSLQAEFLIGYSAADANVGPALDRFTAALQATRLPHAAGTQDAAGALPRADFLVPRPAAGSACKRLHLFLRWMVRGPDGIDLGLWPGVAPRQLLIPLDTHVHRIARKIGLTDRAGADWKTACAITDSLLRIDPADPVRYDLALCKLGMQGRCEVRGSADQCGQCPLEAVCLEKISGASGPGAAP